MSIKRVFTEVEMLDTLNGAVNTTVSVGPRYRTAFSRSNVYHGRTTSAYIDVPFEEHGPEGWAHFFAAITDQTGSSALGYISRAIFALLNSEGELICGLFTYRNSAAVYLINSDFDLSGNTGNAPSSPNTGSFLLATSLSESVIVDLHYLIDEQGFVDVYFNGGLLFSFTGDTRPSSGPDTVSSFIINAPRDNAPQATHFSEFVIADADTPTIGMNVYTRVLTPAGTNDWDGSPSNVVGSSRASTPITSDTDGELTQFSIQDLPTSGIGRVAAVVASFSGRAPTTALVQEVDVEFSNGSGTEVVGNFPLTPGIAGYQVISELNPFTGQPWNVSEVNDSNLRLGLRART